MRKILLAAVPAAVLMPVAASAAGLTMFDATPSRTQPAPAAGAGLDARADVQLQLSGRALTIDLEASGLVPNEPHAVHLHGTLDKRNECPTESADKHTGDQIDQDPESKDPFVPNEPDGYVSLSEGAPDYGPVQVSFTTSGDSTDKSTLSLDRMPVADAQGKVSYHRTVVMSKAVAEKLGQLHVVLHGGDTDEDGTTLESLFQATLPVACGTTR